VAHEEPNRETHAQIYTQKNSGRMERQKKDRGSYITATTKNNSFCPPFWCGTTKAHTHTMFLFLFFFFFYFFFFFRYIVSLFCIPLSLYGTTNIFLEEQDKKNDKHQKKKTTIEKQRLMYETQCIIHASFFSARAHIETSGFTAGFFFISKENCNYYRRQYNAMFFLYNKK